MKHGSDGNPGGNTATLFLYKRSSTPITAIDWNYALTYDFTTQLLSSVPSGWTLNKIPSGTDPVYVTAATAYSTTNSDTIAANEWSTPVEFVENGAHGLNSASVFLYQRYTPTTSNPLPAKPTGKLYYKFADGKLYTNAECTTAAAGTATINGWSQSIPATDGKPCFVIQATAISSKPTDDIATSEWSTQTKLVEDGAAGAPGGNTATLMLYKRSSTPITAIDWNDTLTYTFASKSLNAVPSGWSLNQIPSGSDPIYVTAATAYSTSATDTIASNEWSAPVEFVENGAHGMNTAPVFLYKRYAPTTSQPLPAKPSGTLTYTFATGVLSGTGTNPLAGWSQSLPAADGNPCFMIQATAIGSGATDTIASTEWSEQRIIFIDGTVVTIGTNGHWYINGEDTGIQAEGKNGTGIELKGTVEVVMTTSGKTSLQSLTGMSVGDCYMVQENGWLYFYDGESAAASATSSTPASPQGWKPVGKIKGEPGQSQYIHIAYADSITLSGSTVSAVSGFTVNKNKDGYDWMGICADDNINDPGSSARPYSSDLLAAKEYTWNYVKGGQGPTGNGINSDDFYYCLTATIEPPSTTYLTTSYGWYLQGSTGCHTAPTQKKPYLWQCEYIQYTTNTGLNKKVLKLVQVYNLESQPQLLEQTAFDSEDAMDIWESKNGEVIPQARGLHNAYGGFPTSASLFELLQQSVYIPGSLTKLLPNEWYTLSFYARTRRMVGVTGHTYGFHFEDIYLKAGTYKLQYNGHCSTSAYNNNVRLNGYLWYSPKNGTEDWSKSVSTTLLSNSDITVTTGALTVSTAGWYRIGFYAWKSAGNPGGESDKVTINWWRVLCTSDNSMISTYVYPSAAYANSTYFVDGEVKNYLGSDASVNWYLDNDDDQEDSGGWVRHSVTFRTKSSIGNEYQHVLFRGYNTYFEICQPKLEKSVMATPWCEHEDDGSIECQHNPRGDWASGTTYYFCKGVRDVVRAQKSSTTLQKTWFRMKKRTNIDGYVSTTNPYADTAHWERADFLSFLATQLLLADEAIIKNLVAEIIKTGYSGMPHIEAKGSTFQIFSNGIYPIVELDRNDAGHGVLRFRNEDTGAIYYDLGPDGISKTPGQDEYVRYIDRYMEVGYPDNNDSLIDDAYSYKAEIFNSSHAAANVTNIYQYEAKIVAGIFDAGQYCASAEHAQQANMRWFRTSASSTASGNKFIRDIVPMTGLLCYSYHQETGGGLRHSRSPFAVCGEYGIPNTRMVPEDYDTLLDGGIDEVNFMTDDDGYYVDEIYWRTVIHVVNGKIAGRMVIYCNASQIGTF